MPKVKKCVKIAKISLLESHLKLEKKLTRGKYAISFNRSTLTC